MQADHAIFLAIGLSFAASAFFFLLIILRNPRWYLHVVNFLTGVVTIGLGLCSLGAFAAVSYVLIARFGFEFGGIYLVAGFLTLLAIAIGAPLASTALADVLERNGYRVGRRAYLILLVVGIPVIPIAAFFGAFSSVGQRIVDGRVKALGGLLMITLGGVVLIAVLAGAGGLSRQLVYLVLQPAILLWIGFGGWVAFRGMLRE